MNSRRGFIGKIESLQTVAEAGPKNRNAPRVIQSQLNEHSKLIAKNENAVIRNLKVTK